MNKILRMLAVACLTGAWAAGPAAAQEGQERLHLFGHLTQAFAGSSAQPILGVPDGFTADYRSAAIQLRVELSSASSLVLQTSHRRLGSSPLMVATEDLDLDWAFYQHRFGDLRLRVGKVPVTAGIYNETRDVGTLLPFFRAPGSFYIEGTESVDGLTLGYARYLGAWSFEAHAWAGGIEYQDVIYMPQAPPYVVDAHWDGNFGGQLWVGLPLRGVRLGSALFSVNPDGELASIDEKRPHVWLWSLEAERERFALRGEVLNVDAPSQDTRSQYIQGGVDVWGPVALVAQVEWVDREVHFPMSLPMTRVSEDHALGVNVRARPDLVFKLEGHRTKGYLFDMFVDPTGPAARTTYGIASIAVSF